MQLNSKFFTHAMTSNIICIYLVLVHNNNDTLAYVPPLFVISMNIIQLEITSIWSRVSVYNHQSISTLATERCDHVWLRANKVGKEILCFTVNNHKTLLHQNLKALKWIFHKLWNVLSFVPYQIISMQEN